MKRSPNLVSYERALEIISGMPPALRCAMCRRFLHRVLTEGDVVARRMGLPLDHPERFALPEQIWFGLGQLILHESFIKDSAKDKVASDEEAA